MPLGTRGSSIHLELMRMNTAHGLEGVVHAIIPSNDIKILMPASHALKHEGEGPKMLVGVGFVSPARAASPLASDLISTTCLIGAH